MYRIREGKAEDIPFVLNSLLKRYRDAIPIRLVTDRVYYENQHHVVTHIMQSPGAKLLVACDPEHENTIFGYCLAEDLTPDWVLLHFAYVKGAFRRFGLAKDLIKQAIGSATKVQYTHSMKSVKWLNKENTWEYNCFYVWAIAKPEKDMKKC